MVQDCINLEHRLAKQIHCEIYQCVKNCQMFLAMYRLFSFSRFYQSWLKSHGALLATIIILHEGTSNLYFRRGTHVVNRLMLSGIIIPIASEKLFFTEPNADWCSAFHDQTESSFSNVDNGWISSASVFIYLCRIICQDNVLAYFSFVTWCRTGTYLRDFLGIGTDTILAIKHSSLKLGSAEDALLQILVPFILAHHLERLY